jgi:hypothetical protein
MELVCGANLEFAKKLYSLGHDLESLYCITKEYFTLCDSLGLSCKQTAEMFARIRTAYDYVNGKETGLLMLYENHRYNPSRLSVDNKLTGKFIFFKIIPGQLMTKKIDLKYCCETCRDGVEIKRAECRLHTIQYHK